MVRRLPPLNALRAFEAAARLGSFAKAADELAVTPAAVSHQVKGLEAILGVPLFHRLPRSLRLTDDGRRYLPELTKGFDQLARAADSLNGREAVRGRLTVTAMASVSYHWLVPRLPDFQRRYPEVSVRFHTTARKVDFLREDVDVGIRYGLGSWPGLRSTFLMGEDVFPVAAPRLVDGDPPLRRWEDLRGHRLLHDHTALPVEPWNSWHPWLRQTGLGDIDTEAGLHFDNSELLIRAAIDGQGVAIGRTALVADAVGEGLLIPLFGARRPAEFSYYAVAPEATADQPKTRAFVEWLVEQARPPGG